MLVRFFRALIPCILEAQVTFKACIFAPNHLGMACLLFGIPPYSKHGSADYAVAVWAVHTDSAVLYRKSFCAQASILMVNIICSTINPAYTADELHYQLPTIKTSLLLVHPAMLGIAQPTARKTGLPTDRVVLFERLPNSSPASHAAFQELVTEGLSKDSSFVERRLDPGEAKTKLAFLCFSSGTTGRPKVREQTLGCKRIYQYTVQFPTMRSQQMSSSRQCSVN
jgi:acyl-CoA synthetase (AMP-forming)/AMP-acid ligase II